MHEQSCWFANQTYCIFDVLAAVAIVICENSLLRKLFITQCASKSSFDNCRIYMKEESLPYLSQQYWQLFSPALHLKFKHFSHLSYLHESLVKLSASTVISIPFLTPSSSAPTTPTEWTTSSTSASSSTVVASASTSTTSTSATTPCKMTKWPEEPLLMHQNNTVNSL